MNGRTLRLLGEGNKVSPLPKLGSSATFKPLIGAEKALADNALSPEPRLSDEGNLPHTQISLLIDGFDLRMFDG